MLAPVQPQKDLPELEPHDPPRDPHVPDARGLFPRLGARDDRVLLYRLGGTRRAVSSRIDR